MRALTLQEPWAWAVVDASLGSDAAKIVENRTETFAAVCGPLLIHSGKGKRYCDLWHLLRHEIREITGLRCPEWHQIAGRGLIGVCRVVGVCGPDQIRRLAEPDRPRLCTGQLGELDRSGYPWAAAARWAEGPRCLLLADVAAFARPIEYRGYQGLFDVQDAIVADAVEQARERLAIRMEGSTDDH